MPTNATVSSFIDFADSSWCDSHPPSFVRPNAVPATFGDKIETLVKAGGRELHTSSISGIPWVLVENLPAARYPQYMEFSLRCTMAWLRAENIPLHNAIAAGSSMSTLVPIVGVRAGMVHSMGVPAVASELTAYLHYDTKRGNLWVRKASNDARFSRWLDAMSRTPAVPSSTLESMLAWCSIAPLVACMATSMEYSVGMSYSVPFVQRSISQHLQASMRPASYAAAALGHPLTWDAASQAAMSGYPLDCCSAWASDQLLALCAERRVQTDVAAIEHSRARAGEVKARMKRSSAATPTSPSTTSALWDAVRLASTKPRVQEMDDVTVATGLMSMAREKDVEPDDSVSNVHTAVPSRLPTPPNAMTRADIADIRAAATAAQQLPNRAASMVMNANAEESVVW